MDTTLEAVEKARDESANTDRREGLDQLGSRLLSQATRETIPALGTRDGVQTKLREVEADATDQRVATSVAEAREHILTFLGTLHDRVMRQQRE